MQRHFRSLRAVIDQIEAIVAAARAPTERRPRNGAAESRRA